VLVRAALEGTSVSDIALELAGDWRKMPGCTNKKAEELLDDCLSIAAEAIGSSTGDGLAIVAANAERPKKVRRRAFDLALHWSLDAAAVGRLVEAGTDLRVASKTMERVEAWHAGVVEAGRERAIGG
jgi:hypothetical protein